MTQEAVRSRSFGCRYGDDPTQKDRRWAPMSGWGLDDADRGGGEYVVQKALRSNRVTRLEVL